MITTCWSRTGAVRRVPKPGSRRRRTNPRSCDSGRAGGQWDLAWLSPSPAAGPTRLPGQPPGDPGPLYRSSARRREPAAAGNPGSSVSRGAL